MKYFSLNVVYIYYYMCESSILIVKALSSEEYILEYYSFLINGPYC